MTLLLLLTLGYNAYNYNSQKIVENKMVEECTLNQTCYQVAKEEGGVRYYEVHFKGVENEEEKK